MTAQDIDVYSISYDMKLLAKITLASAILLLCFNSFTSVTYAQVTGAIFTTDVSCNGTNVNILTDKSAVYLDGGPHHTDSAGLPDGNYYVQVTDPSGATILGKSISPVVAVLNGSFTSCYQLSSILFSASSSFVGQGYDDTTNNGGEYKVWVSQDATFTHGDVKTDNFKVKSNPQDQTGSITGLKWQDDNADGVQQGTEPLLPNWQIVLWDQTHTTQIASTATDAQGFYEFDGVQPGTYQVCEVIPDNTWYPSFPTTNTPNCNNTVAVTANTATNNINFGNYQHATVTVIKHVMNDNGGNAEASAFNLHVMSSGIDVTNSPAAGSETGTSYSLQPGSYTVSEDTPLAGYAQTGITGNCDTNGSIVLTSGANVTCTITNDDIAPKLHLRKIVINDNGGDAQATDWTLTATGSINNNNLSGITPVDSDTSLQADTFALSESNGPKGYAPSDWVCVGGQQSGGSITLGIGDEATCTITNDDIQPKFTLTKIVINDNGGTKQVSDFPLLVDQTSVVSGEQNGFDAGNYTVSETQQAGYQQTSITGDCDANGNVTLNVGDIKSCTITNDDIAPQLIVIKHVNNQGVGNKQSSDFTMHVNGTNVSNPSFPGAEAPGVKVTLNAGNYNVTESSVLNYSGSFSSDCAGSIDIGQTKTCTITNTYKPATRTLGFWQTHTAFTSTIFNLPTMQRFVGVNIPPSTGTHKGIITNTLATNSSQLFGAFYAGISKTTTGTSRTAIDQDRMILLQQLVAAKLNCAMFACTTTTLGLITTADANYAGSNAAAILSSANALDAYNNSNDNAPLGSSYNPGSATSSLSSSYANKVFWNQP